MLLLALVAAWPVAHYAWVQTQGVSPWKFFGWAMYTVPRFQASFEFRSLDGGPEGILRYPARSPAGRQAIQQYRQDELAWLRQTDPTEMARAVFAAYPRVRRLELTRRLARYDVDAGLPVSDAFVDVFDRDHLGR